MAESKSAALPLGYAPMHGRIAAGVRLWPGANITARPPPINDGAGPLMAINTGIAPYNAARPT